VMLIGKKARYAVELLLPSRKVAEAFIRSLTPEEEGAAVANRLSELLSATSRTAKRR